MRGRTDPLDDLYNRQESLDLTPPGEVCIIGVGGVGSWVGMFLPMVGTHKIYLIDDDEIEAHNLNRTPFKTSHIGMSKVAAMYDLITERRKVDVEIFPQKWEDLSEVDKAKIQNTCDCIIDCRDSAEDIGIKCPITGGYDGYRITLHKNPSDKFVHGDREVIRYRTIPSYLVPPVIIAATIVNFVCCEAYQSTNPSIDGERTASIDMRNLLGAFIDHNAYENQKLLDSFQTPCEIAKEEVK
jgi:hypothetical protein